MGHFLIKSHQERWDLFCSLGSNKTKKDKIMRSLKELITQYDRIWFSIVGDKTLRLQFMSELKELGHHWINKEPVHSSDSCNHFMVTVQNQSRHSANVYGDGKVPIKIDYKKYSRGDKDYFADENS